MNTTTKARPRRSPNRVRLVELDGSPVRPSAESWPSWTDNHFWEPTDRVIGTDSMGHDVHESDCRPEPADETAEEFLARVASEEAAELARVMAEYQPLPEDLEEYRAWSEALDAGLLTGEDARRFRFGSYRVDPMDDVRVSCFTIAEWDAIRSGQVTEDELSQRAAHGCI